MLQNVVFWVLKAGGTYTLYADVLWTVVTMVGFPVLSLTEVWTAKLVERGWSYVTLYHLVAVLSVRSRCGSCWEKYRFDACEKRWIDYVVPDRYIIHHRSLSSVILIYWQSATSRLCVPRCSVANNIVVLRDATRSYILRYFLWLPKLNISWFIVAAGLYVKYVGQIVQIEVYLFLMA